ncbi:MAG TPA: ribose 5-phosphate isomerase A [Candidatus Angelobacter sp.]|nr:ribose 5-phosphate isomerase A [Candidatus Angelobacter sp.]
MVDLEAEKLLAAQAAAALVEDGMKVGLGTGSTVAHLLTALAGRGLAVRCVSTSPRTESVARSLGLEVTTLDALGRLDIAIDGADQVDDAGWLIKGGGAAHTREKIVAAAADRFVVMVDSTKPVPTFTWPVPLELLEFGLTSTMALLGDVRLRDVPRSPDGGVIADWHGDLDDPAAVAAFLAATPGVVEHGLFPPSMTSDVVIARGTEVEHRRLR